MKVVTLVPRRANPDRDRLWTFCSNRWRELHPDFPVFEGNHDSGLFNRSLAINQAAELAGHWDVAIILDADVLIDPRCVTDAIQVAVQTDGLVVAGDKRIHLSRKGTDQILKGFAGSWEQTGFQEKTYTDHWSSCIVITRKLWDAVGGFDPLFQGWGYEDDAFRCACETMADRTMLEVAGTIWHLWHPMNTHHSAREGNKTRADRYWKARFDKVAMQQLLDEITAIPELGQTRIPRILHRTIPQRVDPVVEEYWRKFAGLHPGWEMKTYQDPINPSLFPKTARHWVRCKNGAQKAGLIRLEALLTHGGVYVDSDVEPIRTFEPLLQNPAFAAWEDETTVPDAVLGAEPNHPAFQSMLDKALKVVQSGGDAWQSGPGITTEVLPGRSDVLLLPPGAFFPFHYHQKNKSQETPGPWVFCRHHWHGSWLSPAQKESIRKGQR